MKRALALAGVLIVLVALAGCSGGGSSKAAVQPALDWRGQKNVAVEAKSNLFTPAEIIVSPGTTVTWRNNDAVPHNVKPTTDRIDFGAPFGVDSDKFGPGATYSFTFNKVGEDFYYTCTIHSLMSGRVRVEAGASAPTSVSH